ncbi:MAG: OmpA family protein [Candidatus Nitrotoga sp.]|nr:OmpA family protein [Candidatus Nitrotoga sp.]
MACAKPPVVGGDKSGNADASKSGAATSDRSITSTSGVTNNLGANAGRDANADTNLNRANSNQNATANGSCGNLSGLQVKQSIHYATDADTIKAEDGAIVQAHAQYLSGHPGCVVRLEGNSDERGSSEYNLALGQRRADGIRKMLLVRGVKEGQIESISNGEEKPKAKDHDEPSWLENRRTDFSYNPR